MKIGAYSIFRSLDDFLKRHSRLWNALAIVLLIAAIPIPFLNTYSGALSYLPILMLAIVWLPLKLLAWKARRNVVVPTPSPDALIVPNRNILREVRKEELTALAESAHEVFQHSSSLSLVDRKSLYSEWFERYPSAFRWITHPEPDHINIGFSIALPLRMNFYTNRLRAAKKPFTAIGENDIADSPGEAIALIIEGVRLNSEFQTKYPGHGIRAVLNHLDQVIAEFQIAHVLIATEPVNHNIYKWLESLGARKAARTADSGDLYEMDFNSATLHANTKRLVKRYMKAVTI